jgi:hypothetical protein
VPFGGRSSPDLSAPLYAALSGNSDITDLLGQWQGSAGIFTNRPVPADATYPMIVTAGDVTRSDQDLIADPVLEIIRDISIFGQNTSTGNVNQTRVCDSIALKVRDLFHRQPKNLSVDGWTVSSITATGPIVGPTDDDASVHRLVTLTIRLT